MRLENSYSRSEFYNSFVAPFYEILTEHIFTLLWLKSSLKFSYKQIINTDAVYFTSILNKPIIIYRNYNKTVTMNVKMVYIL